MSQHHPSTIFFWTFWRKLRRAWMATIKYDQFLRLISPWPLWPEPLARWQHFWRSSTEPKPAAWQVQRDQATLRKTDTQSKHVESPAHSTVFSDIYPRGWLKRTLLPSSWLGFLALIVELLPQQQQISFWVFLHVPCVGSMSGQCHITACKYVQVAILSCTRQKGIAEAHDAGEDLVSCASCGTLEHSGKKANILLLRQPHARTNSVWPAGPKLPNGVWQSQRLSTAAERTLLSSQLRRQIATVIATVHAPVQAMLKHVQTKLLRGDHLEDRN